MEAGVMNYPWSSEGSSANRQPAMGADLSRPMIRSVATRFTAGTPDWCPFPIWQCIYDCQCIDSPASMLCAAARIAPAPVFNFPHVQLINACQSRIGVGDSDPLQPSVDPFAMRAAAAAFNLPAPNIRPLASECAARGSNTGGRHV